PLRDRDTELVEERRRRRVRDRRIPAADEYRGDGVDLRVEPRIQTTFDAANERLCGREILFVGKQKRHVDRDAGEDRLLDRRQPFRRAGNLDQQVRPPRTSVQLLGGGECARRVVGQERRHFQRHPPVHAVGPVPNRSKQIGGSRQILERELEEQRL